MNNVVCIFSHSSFFTLFLSLFHIRDILPFTLKLPEEIHSAETLSELHEVAQQGAGTDLPSLTILKLQSISCTVYTHICEVSQNR